MSDLGKIHVYTGNGKGKTTSALGLAIRARSVDYKVIIIYFDKTIENCSEFKSLDKLGIEYKFFGINRCVDDKFRFGYNDEDVSQILSAWSFSKEIILLSDYNVIILDEILNCMNYLNFKELESVLKSNLKSEIILTGRNASDDIINLADLVTENMDIKHYFDNGLVARKGIEY